MLFDNLNLKRVVLENKLFTNKGISLSVLRLDQVHPVISGNKLFKLHYFLEDAIASSHKTVITFGGAYSNHLSATAYACKISGVKSIGIVRGEEAEKLSHTLLQCKADGMLLRFVSREEYSKKDTKNFHDLLTKEFGEHILIPEGGFHPMGAKGASLIMDHVPQDTTHICCGMGTATTSAGLMLKKKPSQYIIGISALKGISDFEKNISTLTSNQADLSQLNIFHDYHFGGYAKRTPELISFMNNLYEQYNLPIDFVYTGKMMYAVIDQIKKDYFPLGSKILCIHTGGLQGNLSLPAGTLFF